MRNSVRRASRVVKVCVRQGLGFFVHRFGLAWHIPLVDRLFGIRGVPDSLPVRVRMAMEELGGSYVKLGQLLALRSDLVPEEFCQEFRKLLDHAAPMSFDEVKFVIESELKRSLNSVFLSFERRPLGSASIAQVHRAQLKNGKNVVVKVMRPGVEEQIKADIEILYYLARKAERHNDFSPVLIVEEFERYTKNELDFLVEARNIERFWRAFRAYNSVVIPQVYWGETTHRLLVMDFLDGVKLSDVKIKLSERRLLAQRVLDVCLAQVFEIGVFHADLHPGNVLLLSKGRIGLLDFGIVGELDEKLRRYGQELFVALSRQDGKEVARILLEIGGADGVDRGVLAGEIELVVNEWYAGLQAKATQVRTTQMMQRLFELCVRYKLRLPRDVVLLGKALVTAEGTALLLDPEIDFVEYARPKIKRLLLRRYSLRGTARRVFEKGRVFTDAVWSLPRETVELMEHVKHNKIKVGIADTDVKHLGLDISWSSNRLSFALLVSALVIAGSLLVEVGPRFFGYSVASVLFFFAAGVLLVPFVVSIVREGRCARDTHEEYKQGQ